MDAALEMRLHVFLRKPTLGLTRTFASLQLIGEAHCTLHASEIANVHQDITSRAILGQIDRHTFLNIPQDIGIVSNL